MAWKDQSHATYTGGSGQMAVIAELLHRKCNAAIPAIDVGTDVFAFRDDSEAVARIQVKTAVGKPYKDGPGYSAKFGIPTEQLKRDAEPPLFYVLVVRVGNTWGNFLTIDRLKLKELWVSGCGSENAKSGQLELRVQVRNDGAGISPSQGGWLATCGKFNLTEYLDAWESLPPLTPDGRAGYT